MYPTNDATISHILFAPDIDYANNPLNAAWIASFVEFLKSESTEVDFLARFPENHPLHDHLKVNGVKVIPPTQFSDPDSFDAAGVTARFRARQIISVATDTETPEYEIVLTQGLTLSKFIAGNGSLQTVHWAMVDEHPFEESPRFITLKKSIEAIATNAKIILTSSAVLRRQMESQIPSSTSKTRLLPIPALTNAKAKALLPESKYDNRTFAIDYQYLLETGCNYDFHKLSENLNSEKRPPRFVLASFPDSPSEADIEYLEKSAINKIPGLVTESNTIYTSHFLSTKTTFLIPSDLEESKYKLAVAQAQNYGLSCYELFAGIVGPTIDSLSPDSFSSVEMSSAESFSTFFSRDLPDYNAVSLQERPVKVLLAGSDFKFAGDIVDGLVQRKDIDLRVDLFESNAKPQPKESQPLLKWAEVIVAEFASKNAIWYSQNVQPHQKLIVHLHGYELLQDWIDELVIANCHRIVFASEFYRAKAIELKQWPADKLVVIPNSVNPGDLERKKSSEAHFHLGIVGIVPILKRPDRVLDLLEKLLEHDDRYVLHIKGHSPWNYVWEWKKAAHQDSYRKFYARIGESELLSQHIIFEPFSPDIGNWLTKIGWILSPSTRETFHLSAIEGAASGSVPIAWRRAGSEEIIGYEHNIDDLNEAVEKVLSGRDSETFSQLSARAKRHARRFDVQKVKAQWLSLVFRSYAQSQNDVNDISSADAQLIRKIESALDSNEPEAALAILDENISVTKNSTGSLKDVENYIRGMVALDEKRFTHFLPSSEKQQVAKDFVLVRPTGASNLAVALSGIDESVIDIDPPRYLNDPSVFSAIDNTDDPLPDPGTIHYQNTNRLRLDRWIQSAKIEIEDFIEEEGLVPYLVAQGPWWVAMPTALAADQMGLPFVWIIDGSDDTLSELTRTQEPGTQSDFRLQSILSTFNRADLRLLISATDIQKDIPFWNINGYISLDNAKPVAGIRAVPSRSLRKYISDTKSDRLALPSASLIKSLSDLRIGFIGSTDSKKELEKLVKEVIQIPVENYNRVLTPNFDAVIIEESANNTGPWKGKLENSDSSALSDTTKILDRARLYGSATIFIHNSDSMLSKKFFSTARKADTLATTNGFGVTLLLEEHPTSIYRLALWNKTQVSKQRWITTLRAAGIAVSLDY
ncbi:glycosyltransferase family 4 protein [Corynebacterium glutamicum]|uniref:glycosyltransferase family 4 protein n=1 Tax=Corynebacterium glutamicum TaxID=1718 RepID=UPI00117ED22A|nr:glycosyltransferase family 4 protein [Corynebacterium glutamicum]QDQ19943.1 glycosyltransferase family 4 protein [Corynebacterium glutamicum]QDQ23510.1 glycosyltransferase family 4 protein [Corynebacterium glutamicum]